MIAADQVETSNSGDPLTATIAQNKTLHNQKYSISVFLFSIWCILYRWLQQTQFACMFLVIFHPILGCLIREVYLHIFSSFELVVSMYLVLTKNHIKCCLPFCMFSLCAIYTSSQKSATKNWINLELPKVCPNHMYPLYVPSKQVTTFLITRR